MKIARFEEIQAWQEARILVRREKYFKTYHGKMFLKRRLKSYLTG